MKPRELFGLLLAVSGLINVRSGSAGEHLPYAGTMPAVYIQLRSRWQVEGGQSTPAGMTVAILLASMVHPSATSLESDWIVASLNPCVTVCACKASQPSSKQALGMCCWCGCKASGHYMLLIWMAGLFRQRWLGSGGTQNGTQL